VQVIVHRGSNQIGGSIIEVASDTTRIILDAGQELDAPDDAELPAVSGLFDSKGFDAVFFSHNHLDHIGLAQSIYPDIPLYMGKLSLAIMIASTRYLGRTLGFHANTFSSRDQIAIGDLIITPLLVDHSAFDSYAFLVQCGEERVLYTGDFRATGRKPFEWFLKSLPNHVDILITEGTNLGQSKPVIKESDLEEEAVALFNRHKGPVFVLQASSNIDRLVTMYRAAKRSGRAFFEDLYVAEIASAAASEGATIPNPKTFDSISVFVTRPYKGDEKLGFLYEVFNEYGNKKIGIKKIATQRFVMPVRASMGNYLRSLSKKMSFDDGLLVYSMWGGYKREQQVSDFLELCESLGLKVVTLHTSGHADATTIERLINQVNPDEIIPVHTEHAEWFQEQGYIDQD
jgi:ribonuclease J